MSVNKLLSKRYHKDRYNCVHYAADVWEIETGQDLRQALAGFLAPAGQRTADPALRRCFVALDGPRSPCFVLMRRPRSPSHVGIYLRGKINHIRPKCVAREPVKVATLGYKIIGYYGYEASNGNDCPQSARP